MPDATTQELRAAYYRMARRLHPDAAVAGASRSAPGTEQRSSPPGHDMAAVNEAWRVLSDPARRAMYDAGLRRSATVRPPAGAKPNGAAVRAPFEGGVDDPFDDGDVEFVAARLSKHRLPFVALSMLGAMAAIFLVTAYAGSPGGPSSTVPASDGVLAVGSCVRVGASGSAIEVDCSAAHVGVVATLIDYDGRCPPSTSGYRRRDGVSGYACVAER